MNRLISMLIAIAMAAALSCSQPATEKPPPPAERPDPTVVDAGHYRSEFENDRVRVVRIQYGPGEKSVMHYHPDSVAVFLTDHHVEFQAPDGSSSEVRFEAGQHLFVPAGQHLPRNLGYEPMELVLVELKKSTGTAAADAGPDPTIVDAGHYAVEFENPRVRVVRIRYGPGEESVMHHHPDSVAVFLTDLHAAFGMPDGSSEEVHLEAGQHQFAPGGQHLPRNIGDEPLEVVLVELKRSAA